MVNTLYNRVVIRKRKYGEDTWESIDNGIVLSDATQVFVSKGLAKKRDQWGFKVHNYNNHLFETFKSGDGSTLSFTLKYSPIPSSYLGTDKFVVAVYSGGEWSDKVYSTHYTVSGSTLTFTSGNAPASAIKNIRIRFPLLEVDDLVRIFQWKNMTWDEMTTAQRNASIREEGPILEPNATASDSGKFFTVRGGSLADILFKGLVFTKPSVSKTYSYQYIIDLIAELNEYNSGRGAYSNRPPIMGESASEWASIGNPTLKGNGSAFKEITYNSSYKIAIDQIEELSSDAYTGDGDYIYWLFYDTELDAYVFKWIRKPSDGNEITEGTEPTNIKIEKDVDEIANAFIYNAGPDCVENGQEYFFYDASSGYGSRWVYVTSTNTIGPTLINREYEENKTKYSTDANNARISTSDNNFNSNFPNDAYLSAAVPWTFQFDARNSAGVSTGSRATATSQTTFNAAIRTESYWRGREATQRLADKYNDPKFKSNIEIPYGKIEANNTYTIGELSIQNIPSFGLVRQKLRVNEITYNFWDTDLDCEEDSTPI